jgi:sugar transferase (PEP-CTERM system associated)
VQIPSSRPSPYQIAFVAGEALLMGLGALLAIYLRTGDPGEILTWRYSWHRIVVVPLVLQVAFYYSDLHNFRIARPFLWTVARVAQAMTLGALGLSMVYYLFPRLFLGRGVLLLAVLIITGLVLIWRGLYRWALSQKLFATRLLLLAEGALADSILEELVSRSDNIYTVTCIVDMDDPPAAGQDAADSPNLMRAWSRLLKADLRREANELAGLARHHHAELVVVAMDEKRGRMPLDELLRCRMLGVPILRGEDFLENIAGRILADRINPSWLIFSPGFQTGAVRRITKRGMDLACSLVGLILASPFILLTALLVRLSGPGPVVFRQDRVGQDGRVFTIFKFRTMVADAEAATGPVWAQENDQRVTRVGALLRKLRLDELPQLYNVLRGDMSFVGPRPERPHFVEQLIARLPYYSERHNVKPGVTGWAQVCFPYGASVAAALEKLNYDLYYIKHSSLSMDLMILLQTVKIMLFGGGGR